MQNLRVSSKNPLKKVMMMIQTFTIEPFLPTPFVSSNFLWTLILLGWMVRWKDLKVLSHIYTHNDHDYEYEIITN